jgi:hypothetical protein
MGKIKVIEMDTEKDKKIFETSDLYLATALKLKGFKLIGFEKNEYGRGIFRFENRYEDCSKTVISYFDKTLEGSLKGFAELWRDLKHLIGD